MEAISGLLGLPPPLTYRAFSETNSSLHQIVQQSAIESQLVVSSQLHSLQDTEPKGVADVTVTCDGTWSRRGFMATYVVAVEMSWDFGQVIDAVVISKRCNICKRKENTMDE